MIKIWDQKESQIIDDCDQLMELAGMHPGMGFGGLAIDDDGLPLVCDKCGNYSHLDAQRYLPMLLINNV